MIGMPRRMVGALGFVASVVASSRAPAILRTPENGLVVRTFEFPETEAVALSNLVVRGFAFGSSRAEWRIEEGHVALFDTDDDLQLSEPPFETRVEIPKEPGGAQPSSHEVRLDKVLPRVGDTWTSLAEREGVAPGLAALWNGASDVSATMDPSHAVEIVRGSVESHRVAPGDTLWSISRRFRVPLRDILWMNRSKGLALPVDRVLWLPRGPLAPSLEAKVAADLGVSTLVSRASAEIRDGSENAASRTIGIHVENPVPGRITSGYGWRRHPILQKPSFHRGVDIQASEGTAIRALAAGTVVFAGDAGAGGKSIILRHEDQLYSIYAHCASIFLSKGDEVPAGAEIGRVGKSGLATAPHLHFAMKRGPTSIDPLPYLRR